MVAPDVQTEGGKGAALGPQERRVVRTGMRNGVRLPAGDYPQDHTPVTNILHSEDPEKDGEFEVIAEGPEKWDQTNP